MSTSGIVLVGLGHSPSMTSSAASGAFFTLASSELLMRVMDSRFSTMRMSHSASSLVHCSSCWRCSGVRVFSCSSSTLVAPTMLVSGVRMSWDTARSRSAYIFSRSASRRHLPVCLARLVTVAVRMEMVIITRNVSGKPVRVKLMCQKG